MTGQCRSLRLRVGALEPAEAGVMCEHLVDSEDCAKEYARLAPPPGLITLAEGLTATAEPLSPAVKERVLDAVAAEAPGGQPRRRSPALRRAFRPRTAWSAPWRSPRGAIALATQPWVDLRAAGGWSGARARAQLDNMPAGIAVHLEVRALPGNPAAVYEVHWAASD